MCASTGATARMLRKTKRKTTRIRKADCLGVIWVSKLSVLARGVKPELRAGGRSPRPHYLGGMSTEIGLRPSIPRHSAFQFLEPVRHDVDLCRRCLLLLSGSHHQEALPVRANRIIGPDRRKNGQSNLGRLEQQPRLTRAEVGLSLDIHSHHLRSGPIEQFVTLG